MGFFATTLLCSLLIVFSFFRFSSSLSSNYYDKTCPGVEKIVAKVVKEATSRDSKVPATLIRMHFHDCFIRGCDGSILLESKGGKKAERDGPPNGSMHAFYVIEEAKREVEAVCPGIVSCADILAFAARDSVVLSGGPRWEVPKGRKDGRTSKASETAILPSPLFNISQLQKAFGLRGLSLDDLVALTGAHTLGFAHCSSFQSRIHKFNSTHDVDPTLRPSFASSLKGICPLNNRAKNAGMNMDSTPTTFDTTHYKLIIQRKTLFFSDQSLLTTPRTKRLVYRFATSKKAFHKAFAKSMIKMSGLNGGQEIRKDCRFVN
ncbi:peroxidase 64 [Andrographis paniculata]|uniref:peroxidase 64 n=1 Tax=Andrographis paniculata TaxID=175694 RepID=UPI0021E83DAE|nr:peroxidase 64 [Andrographis paniculata]